MRRSYLALVGLGLEAANPLESRAAAKATLTYGFSSAGLQPGICAVDWIRRTNRSVRSSLGAPPLRAYMRTSVRGIIQGSYLTQAMELAPCFSGTFSVGLRDELEAA